jgi:hypothetical protein
MSILLEKADRTVHVHSLACDSPFEDGIGKSE